MLDALNGKYQAVIDSLAASVLPDKVWLIWLYFEYMCKVVKPKSGSFSHGPLFHYAESVVAGKRVAQAVT